MTDLSTSTKRLDIITLGEVLIDLISSEPAISLREAEAFERFLGGQPTNLAVNMARLGFKSGVCACLGEDGFGRYAYEQMKAAGVNVDNLQKSLEAPTSMAIITRHPGTADFLIARGADAHLAWTQSLGETAAGSRIVHTSAFGLSRDPARSTILKALKAARNSGAIVTLDPNYHPKFWPDTSDYLSILEDAYGHVAITKPSLDDCSRLFGAGKTPTEYIERFIDWGCETVILTMGADGLLLATSSGERYKLEANNVQVADSTGAGDAFWAGFLSALLEDESLIDAARRGQVLAEVKVRAFGPLADLPDSEYLQRRASTISYSDLNS
jgi:fructokinase